MSLDSIHAVLPTTPCRVALIGFGTVGSAVARRLLAADPGAGLRLTHIFDRHAEQQRLAANLENPENPENPENLENLENLENPQNPVFWTSTIDDILQSDADIIVEAIGGLDPAGEWIRSALEAGKSVVTANKQLIARHGPDLWALAARQGRQLRFEAAPAGLPRSTPKLSSDSTVVSPLTATVTVFDVSPGANVSEPVPAV